MLQPPPSAKVMEGKERPNRSRSGSKGSSRLGTDEPSLSRQVTGRAVEERIRRGENPSELELRSIPSTSKSPLPGVTTPKAARIRSDSLQSVGSSGSEGGMRRNRRPPPLSKAAVDETSKLYSVEHIPTDVDGTSVRPHLATIASSSTAIPQVESLTSKVMPFARYHKSNIGQ